MDMNRDKINNNNDDNNNYKLQNRHRQIFIVAKLSIRVHLWF